MASLSTTLERAAGAACAAAPPRGRLSYVSTEIDPMDPIDLARSLGGPDLCWQDPQAGFSVAGIGEARSWTGGPEIADPARVALSQIEPVGGSAESVPCCLGGFAFDPTQADGDGLWTAFGPGRLVLPSLTIWSRTDAGGARRSWAAWTDEAQGGERDLRETLSRRLDSAQSRATEARRRPKPHALLAPSSERWVHAVNETLAEIRSNRLSKAVLARAWAARFDDRPGTAGALDLFRRLRAEEPDSIGFFVSRPSLHFLGATPEILFRQAGRVLSSTALAGTARRGATSAEDLALGEGLAASAKDRHEHDVVVRALERALWPLSDEVEVPREPRIRKLRHVQHLETPLSARLRAGVSPADLLAALHPTPAVCGEPRDAARRWLSRQEDFPRGWYAGPVGWVGRDDSAFAVAIRSILLAGTTAWVFAGAGIVAGSDAEAEARETEAKARPALRALGIDA